MMDVARRLSQVGQWVTPCNSTDMYGELITFLSTPSTATTVSCYCYQEGSKELIFGDTILQRLERWRVVLPPERTDVREGDFLIHVLDHRGLLVMERARIKDIETYRRHRTGVEAIIAVLEVN